MDIVRDLIAPALTPKRVTDFWVDTFEITEPNFYSLPDKTQELIRAYSEPVISGKNGVFKFRMPIYRWEEINQSMNVLPSAPTGEKK